MLQKIIIKKLAIIENAEIEFSKDLNIITGETGSGKSLIVNAIDLLLGAKFSKENFRDKEEIELVGYFIFSENDVEIKRIFSFSGNNKTFLNSKQITNQELKQITKNYIYMHGQNSQHSIFDKSCHIDYLDSFGDYSNLLIKMYELFSNYEKNKKELFELETINADIANKKDLYQYQLLEINEIDLYLGVDSDLSEKYDKISNVEDVRKSIDNIVYLLDEKEDNLKIEFSKIIKIFNRLTTIDKDFSKFTKLFEDIKINLDEIGYDLNLKKDEYVFNDREFSQISNDLEKVQMIKRKYGGTIDSAISYKDKIEKYLNDFSNIDNKIGNLKEAIYKDKIKLEMFAEKVSKKRLKNIPIFEKNINLILKKLNMEDAIFAVNLTQMEDVHEKGYDCCEFYIRTNKGSKIKPLIKIASGGEISRIMLAIKILMQNKTSKETLIFDEIDLGISGKAAENLGNNLLKLSCDTQVICISHLPQVASKGNNHYKVFKKTNKNLTFSNIVRLNSDSRINEIAQMLSGREITDSSVKQAKYLLGL